MRFLNDEYLKGPRLASRIRAQGHELVLAGEVGSSNYGFQSNFLRPQFPVRSNYLGPGLRSFTISVRDCGPRRVEGLWLRAIADFRTGLDRLIDCVLGGGQPDRTGRRRGKVETTMPN
jgi:hypothetical protein